MLCKLIKDEWTNEQGLSFKMHFIDKIYPPIGHHKIFLLIKEICLNLNEVIVFIFCLWSTSLRQMNDVFKSSMSRSYQCSYVLEKNISKQFLSYTELS